MDFNRSKFFKLAVPSIGAGARKYMLPYLVGAQFGGAAGVAILDIPLSIARDIDIAVAMIILLMICGIVDLGGALQRRFSGCAALSAEPNL